MAVRMTPGQTPQRDALRSVSTSVLTGVSTTSFDDVAGAAATTGRRFTDVVGRTLSSMVATTNRSAARVSTSSAPAQLDARFAVVTPIGDDGLGITTAAAVEGRSGVIEAMLPTGAVVSAELLGTDDGVALVQLATPPSETAAFVGATDKEWTVVAYGDEHAVDEEGDDLMSLELPEAAPIFDADGDLVGLCTIGPNGIEVLRVTIAPGCPHAAGARVVRTSDDRCHQRADGQQRPAARRDRLDRSASVDGARVDDRQLVAARHRQFGGGDVRAVGNVDAALIGRPDHLTRSGRRFSVSDGGGGARIGRPTVRRRRR